jgi:glucosyl-dolichyl phosphate glucuronosyltransferase
VFFLARPADRFEIIVADNASTDDTSQTIADCCQLIPNLRAIKEPRQGVHFARNSAALVARGEILYFTDDDMVADRQMLWKLVEAFSLDPAIAAVTGTILGRFLVEPPAWVRRCMSNAWLSLTPPGNPDVLVVSKQDMIFSCHQAVRREPFFRSGGFNPENTAGIWIGDGETGLNIKLAELGYLFAFTASAITYHLIPPSRTTLRYLIRRFKNQGFTDSCIEYRRHRSRTKIMALLLRRSTFGAMKLIATSLANIAIRRESWHFLIAWPIYLYSRTVYDIHLLVDADLRRIVEIDNWINYEGNIHVRL